MRGGYRAGAGRKKGFSAKNAEEVRRILSEMVMREIVPIGNALISRAKNGEVVAVRELFDRAFGKAPQTAKVDLSSDQLEPSIVNIISYKDFTKGSEMSPDHGGLSNNHTPENK
jgi:hypothetical protein